MIIGVKGTRTAEAENPAEAYLLKYDPTRSKAPLAIGLALAGVMAYLRSMLPSAEAADSEAEADAAAPPPDAPAPDEAVAAAPPAAEAATERGQRPAAARADSTAAADAAPGLAAPSSLSLAPVPSSAGTGAVRFQPRPDAGAGGPPSAWPGFPDGSGGGAFPGGRPPGAGGTGGTGTGGAGAGPKPPTSPGAQPPAEPDETTQPPADPGDGGPTQGEEEKPERLNRAPRVSGPVRLPDVATGAVLVVGLGDLLRGTVDADGDSLSVENIVVSAGSVVAAGASWVFTAPGALGPVTITYMISDGVRAVPQVAQLAVVRPKLEGSGADDLLIGTPFADEIDGRDGDDNIDAREGDDVVFGGAGDDHIHAGAGDDLVHAGPGDDIVFGGSGADRIFGGTGSDRLFGGDGDDILHGEAGADALYGEGGADVLFGGAGDDRLSGGAGGDAVFGGDGDDWVIGDLDGVSDVYDGGAGFDTLDYSQATQSVTVDLAAGLASGVEIGEDSLSGFESVIGGAGNDRLVAGAGPTVFAGSGGANLFEYASAGVWGAPVTHAILDFRIGDTIRISTWDIFARAEAAEEDRFRKVYGEETEPGMPIRYRHEETAEGMRTWIEADLDLDEQHETIVTIGGQHFLAFIETA